MSEHPKPTMSVLAGAVGGALVAAAYRPLLRTWPLSASHLSSALASETPGLLAGVHLLAARHAARAGGPAGAAGLVLNAGALAGLAGLAGDARRSARVLDTALHQSGVDGELVTTRKPPGVRHGPSARKRYRQVADIRYSEHGRFGTLDVWHRDDLSPHGRAPVLIHVHGGAWQMGDKVGQGEPLLGYLAEQGWVCVNINHRLAPAARWPAMIVDVKRAIAWTRRHIADHGGDPGFIAITGGSSGAHLAALAALSPNDPDFQPGFTDIDTSLAAAVPMYGVHDLTRDAQGLWKLLEGKVFDAPYAADSRLWEQASPIRRVGPHAPPFLVIHGSTDAVVGVDQSRMFVEALRSESVSPVGYAELPHAQHGFDVVATARTAHTVVAVHRFLAAMHQRALNSNHRPAGRRRQKTKARQGGS